MRYGFDNFGECAGCGCYAELCMDCGCCEHCCGNDIECPSNDYEDDDKYFEFYQEKSEPKSAKEIKKKETT